MKSTKTQKMYITLISVMKQINALDRDKKIMMKLKYLSKIQIII